MEEINFKKQTDDYDEIDSISQDQEQFDNAAITLYRVGKKIMLEESAFDHRAYFILDTDEQKEVETGSMIFLKSQAHEWALNCENPKWEDLCWGIIKPAEVEIEEDETKGINEFAILRRRGYKKLLNSHLIY